ncbi:MAG: hypothetical protein CMJ42_20020 [Phyllobacteriaceae bacterium]|nr:hypothetical protein [Phyllobacteriaceae bacterium]MBA90301.1 hypothetical protein [Phyllobacteriaceae bacterium]
MAAAASIAAPFAPAALADETIHIVVPYQGGGTVDSIVRMVAEGMSKELGQPVVVENKPGANGIIGSQYVASAKPDGLTLLSGGTGPVSLNAMLRPELPYKVESFAPVAMLFDGPLSVTVPTWMKVDDIDGLKKYAADNGNPLRYGTMGPGSVTNLFGLLLEQQLGTEMVDVAYKNNPSSLVDLIGGQAELSFATPIALVEHMKAGDVKILALTTKERHPKFPDIPTMVELGYTDLIASFWTGLLAPAGTPQETVDRLGAAAVKAMNTPEITELLTSRGLNPLPGGPQAMADQLAHDQKVWGAIIKENNLTIQ